MNWNVWINIDLLCALTEVVRASRGRAYCIMMGPGDVSRAEITSELSGRDWAPGPDIQGCWLLTHHQPLPPELRMMLWSKVSWLPVGRPGRCQHCYWSSRNFQLPRCTTSTIEAVWVVTDQKNHHDYVRAKSYEKLKAFNFLCESEWCKKYTLSIESCHVRNLIIKLTTCLFLMTLR